MDYLALLEHSFKVAQDDSECPPDSRLEWLGDSVFDFTTYDGEMSDLFARKALEVCMSITERTTFDYIKDPSNYQWYLLMCNLPFFAERLEWGTSVRRAWWCVPWGESQIKLRSCGLYEGSKQVLDLGFSVDEWEEFTRSMSEFTRDEMLGS